MNNGLFKFKCKKRNKTLMAFAMSMLMIISSTPNAFAEATPPSPSYVMAVSFDGGNVVQAVQLEPGVTNAGQFLSSSFTEAYQKVPVDTTFTITTNIGRLLLYRGSWDPDTGTLSATIMNRDLVQIQDADGNKISDVSVSNSNDPNKLLMDATIKVHPEKPLNYDTNYKLVVKKYFSQSNKSNPPLITGIIPEDVIIPFKTAALQKPTLTKAELRGTNLCLEGLTKAANLEYNFAADGNFDNANWNAFTYTDDTANIEVSNMNLTSASKIMVGYANADNSAPTMVSDPIAVSYASTSAPSFTEAVLSGNNLVLNGLPKNAANMEYRIAADGQIYSDWKDLSVASTSAEVSADGLNLVQDKSLIQVRYKASAPWSASEIAEKSITYGIGNSAPLTQGTDTILTDGIKISSVSLNTPGEGEANTVTVRDAVGEKLATEKPNMGFVGCDDEVLYAAGGIYGFNLKGSGDASSNHVKITIPIKMPAVPPSGLDVPETLLTDISKVGIYMLSEYDNGVEGQTYQYWNYMDTAIDTEKSTATVDISGFDSKGKDIILAVKYDRYTPNPYHTISYHSRTDNSITFQVSAADASGIKELTIKRTNRNDSSDVKYMTLSSTDYPGLRNYLHSDWIMWTDNNDLKPGTIYDYIISTATDMVGNKVDNTNDAGKISVALDSVDALVKATQDCIYANLEGTQNSGQEQSRHIVFASGDSQNSVTQQISLPTMGITDQPKCTIEWTSDRTDIIKIASNGFNEVNLPVDEKGNPIEVKVTLTGKITYTLGKPQSSEIETATGTVTVPVIVKWNKADDQVIINTKYSSLAPDSYTYKTIDDIYVNDPVNEVVKAGNFDDSIAKTIVLQHTVNIRSNPDAYINGSFKRGEPKDVVIDGHGKTIKADFDGALFRIDENDGSFTLKNVTIDMNHKNGMILISDSGATKKVFENVKVINAENCQYGVFLTSVSEYETAVNSFTADNCQFSNFKVAAVGVFNDGYTYTYNDAYYHLFYKFAPIPVNISNCTFDGEGKVGYAIVDAFGTVSIDNSTFKNYKGNVSTGWNSSNDSYESFVTDGDGNYYYLYKGIPDGSSSAAILVKELGSANLNNNTITDCDNSILAWTGEKNFNFLKQIPDSSFVAYNTINGVKVDSSTAEQVVDSVLSSNTITEVEGSSTNQMVVQDASDRYNRTTLLAKVGKVDTANSTDNSGSGSSSSSGSGGASSGENTQTPDINSIEPEITTDSDSNIIATFEASKIKNNVVNEIRIQEPKPESKIEVQIPANASASFYINTDSVGLGIPTGVVDLSSLSNGAKLQVSKNIVPAAEANALLANVPQGTKNIGKVFAFNMNVCDSSNNVVEDIHNFASGKSVQVTIKLSSDDINGMDRSKISAFYFDTASNSWVYVGGSFNEGLMTYTFNTTHFTDFTIMEKSSSSSSSSSSRGSSSSSSSAAKTATSVVSPVIAKASDNVKRLSGVDRIETSIAIAKEQFADKAPDAVVLTTANSFPDALSGEGLAYKYNAPMLLVNKSVNESKNVLDYIISTLSKDKNIYILGGAGVVGTDISDYLISQGYKVVRIAGNDRYETNQQIFDNLNVASGTSMVLANGNGFADALSISSIAALKGYPVLLSGKDNLSTNVIKDITSIQPTNVYIIGGTGALSADVEAQIKNINGNINIVRLGGNDRYETSMKIVDYFNLDTDTISVASGKDFPDALSGALLAARRNSSILLINNTDITKQKELLNKHGVKNIIIFGGEGVISSDAANSLIQK